MHRLSKLALVGATTALAVSAIGAPVAATPGVGQLTVVNGVPGSRIDVCINGKEKKSGLKYGKHVFLKLGLGPRKLKIYRANPRKCRGVKMGQRQLIFGSGDDGTIVVTKKTPKLVGFGNAQLGTVPAPVDPNTSYFAWRHAADVAPVRFNYRVWAPGPDTPIPPIVAALGDWKKGHEQFSTSPPDALWQLRVWRPGLAKNIAGPKRVMFGKHRRYEWYFIGSNLKNARIVVFSRNIVDPAP